MMVHPWVNDMYDQIVSVYEIGMSMTTAFGKLFYRTLCLRWICWICYCVLCRQFILEKVFERRQFCILVYL